MNPDAYAPALDQAMHHRGVGLRALTATLAALAIQDWTAPEAQRLVRLWLRDDALGRGVASGVLQALGDAGAFPAIWRVPLRISGVATPFSVAEAVLFHLPQAPVGMRDQPVRDRWLAQAWAACSEEERHRRGMVLVGRAIRQNQPAWLDIVQQTYPQVLQTVEPMGNGVRSWWHSSMGEAEWTRALAWGMEPAHRDALGHPFWTHLTVLEPGTLTHQVLPVAQRWAHHHDPVGWDALEVARYFDRLRRAQPEQAWDRLTEREDWLTLTDETGVPAVATAVANDMWLVTPFRSQLNPYGTQLPQVRDRQGRNLIQALLTNDHRDNSNNLRVDAFRGLVQRGVVPEVTAAGEGLLASQPDLPHHAPAQSLVEELARFPKALWAGSEATIREVVQTIAGQEFSPGSGWAAFLERIPSTASPYWQGLAALHAAATQNEPALMRAVAAGIRLPDLEQPSRRSLWSQAMDGPLADRLRASLREHALRARPVTVRHDRPRRRS